MFDSALAFERYRLEVVRSWPDSAVKDQLLVSIEYSLRRNGQSRGQLDSQAGSGEFEVGRDAMGQPGSEMALSPAPAQGFLPEIEKVTHRWPQSRAHLFQYEGALMPRSIRLRKSTLIPKRMIFTWVYRQFLEPGTEGYRHFD
jgi:hypothetical protein